MNRTSDEQIVPKVATTTTMENKITFPEETTSSYNQGIQEFFNQLAHESTTLAQQMTSPGVNFTNIIRAAFTRKDPKSE